MLRLDAGLQNNAIVEQLEAVDGEDAIEKARKLKPDLILLDVAMPRTNGIVAASVLKEMMPTIRIVSDCTSGCGIRSITKNSVVVAKGDRKAVVPKRGCLTGTRVLPCSDRTSE